MAKRKSLSLQKNDQLSGTFQVIGKASERPYFLTNFWKGVEIWPFQCLSMTWKAPES